MLFPQSVVLFPQSVMLFPQSVELFPQSVMFYLWFAFANLFFIVGVSEKVATDNSFSSMPIVVSNPIG